MKNAQRREYIKRAGILELLSDEEVSRLSREEEASEALASGEEYLDLEHLADGVRKALTPMTPTGQLLPRKSVLPATWSRIVARLSSSESAGPSPFRTSSEN